MPAAPINGDLPQLSLTITGLEHGIVDRPWYTYTYFFCVNSGINGMEAHSCGKGVNAVQAVFSQR